MTGNVIVRLPCIIVLFLNNGCISNVVFSWVLTCFGYVQMRVAEEHVGLDDNKYIGDIVAEFKLSRDRSKGELFQSKLLFKKRLFRESDEAITEPMFVQLSYIQVCDDTCNFMRNCLV